jgi:hypothetical protein
MAESNNPTNSTTQTAERDRLVTRPDEAPLPTPLDPASPEARGGPADPKPVPKKGQGDPNEKNPAPDDIGRTA